MSVNGSNALARLEAALFVVLEGAKKVTLGFSGGVDSALMAYLMGRWQALHPDCRCRAIHVHHGLSDNADQWLEQCQHQAVGFGLQFEAHRVELALKPRISVEAAARQARYQVFEQRLDADEILLTGHHLDDQAETVLLALKRGSGPTGLAAMKPKQRFANGQLLRPWLALPRNDIEQAAAELGLRFIEDESNQDNRYDRNFLRNRILPELRQRWPSITESIARSAELCAEQQALCDEVAAADFSNCHLPSKGLDLTASADFSIPRKNNLLRYFLRQHGALMPSQLQLQQLQTMWHARQDSQPQLQWSEWQLRRYQQGLYLLPRQLRSDLSNHPWNDGLLQNGQHWLLKPCYDGARLRLPTADEAVSVRYDLVGSTVLRPLGRDRSRTLKKLWQEYRVPPWQRSQVAMLCYGDRVVAALGYWLETEFVVNQGEGLKPQQLNKSSY